MNTLEQRLYNNARTLTKLMIMHDLEVIDRDVDTDFDDYFDDCVDVAFIMYGDTILQLFDGERYVVKNLAENMFNNHYKTRAI